MEPAALKKTLNAHLTAYRNYYTLQNLLAVRTCSAIFLALNVVIRLLYWVFPESLTRAQNFPEFNFTNWVFIIVTPVFLISSHVIAGQYKIIRETRLLHTSFIFAFSLYIIGCGIFSSLIVTSDSGDSMTLYLLPLMIVSVIFVFEYIETIVLLIAVEVIYTFFMVYSQSGATDLIYDQLFSVILLCGFYLTSRYFYTYKANYHKQLLEIKEKNVEIENAANFKNQVLGMVAHDLRNPLAAVESTAMIMEMDEIDNDIRESIDIIKASCAKARGIISDLLEAARNDDSKTVETTEIELNAFIRKVIDSWKIHNSIRTNLVFTSDHIPLHAMVNKEKLHRVMDNLITNGIKFSKENDRIEINLTKENNMAVIAVTDHGVGIPKAIVPYLFDRFSQAGRAGIRGEQSTGLGLSIVKQIVERHNGSIDVQSEEDKGSTFKISIPALN